MIVRKHPWIAGGACALLLCIGLLAGGALSVQGSSTVTMSLTPVSPASAPFNITIGSAFQWTCKATNTSGASQTYSLQFFLNTPSGKRIQVRPPVGNVAVNNGSTIGQTSQATTTTAYSTETGGFSFECDAVSNTGTVLGSASFPFSVLALPTGAAAPHFTDVATSAGVVMTHHEDLKNCLNMNGTGAAWADYDHSGHPSLFVSDYGGPSHLFHNNGPGATPQFTDVTATAFPNNLNSKGQLVLLDAAGVNFVDYDNDGFADLLVVAFGAPFLFHNNGNGTFTLQNNNTSFVDTSGNPVMWDTMVMMPNGQMVMMPLRGASAAWADYDNDGYQDFFLGNYMSCMMQGVPMSMMMQPSYLFHNNGNGTFTMVDNLLGGDMSMGVSGFTFGVVWFDLGNGRPDLYIVNDMGFLMVPNQLFRNDGGTNGVNNWTFTEITRMMPSEADPSGAGLKIASMGVAVIDYNRDGCPDIIVTNIANNFLLKNNCTSTGSFKDVSAASGFWRDGFVNSAGTGFTTDITWGVVASDFNNDGWEDAIVGAGSLANGVMPDGVLVNNYAGHFTGNSADSAFLDLSYASNTGAGSASSGVHSSPTLATADFDGDGKMDFVEVNFKNAAVNLYHNDTAGTGNWLEVKLVGGCLSCAPGSGLSNRDGAGGKLTLVSAGGTQYRQIINGSSLGAGNQLIAHFGLGSDTTVTSLTITWPSGLVQTFSSLAANQRVLITEGSSSTGTF